MILGHGIARHHFWGDYKATIVVAFPPTHFTAEALTAAVKTALPSFDVDEDAATGKVVARFFGGDQALDTAIAELVKVAAEKKKILSIARSIDFGEPFVVDLIPAPTEVQQPLFEETR
jgi:hypothetical protein